MTTQEASEILKEILTDMLWGCGERSEAVEMAIKALEQQPCDDCISRQAVDTLSKELVHTTKDKADFLCNFWEGLQKLPPVTPKEKTGKWQIIEGLGYYTCSVCKCDSDVNSSYCPNCGAKMEGEELVEFDEEEESEVSE